jgi:hypothetical protein
MPGFTAVTVDWKELTGEQFEPFRALCLQPADWFVKSYTCPRHCGCSHRVILRHDRTSAAAECRCDPPHCSDITLSLADITPLELSWTRLALALAKTFGFAPKFVRLQPPGTVQFGAWPPNPVPAILTVQNIPALFQTAIAQLVALLHKPFILFAPTACMLDAFSQALLENCGAAFFPLDATALLKPDGTLLPARPPSELFARFSPQPSTINSQLSTTHMPRYALRKGLGVWDLIFDGEQAPILHEKGVFYVAWLLYNPPEYPIHAIDLAGKIPEIFRHQLGLPELVDPATGKPVLIESHARIQERSLALDDAQALRCLDREEKELEAILDSKDESESDKAEALRKLEEIIEFKSQYGRRSSDSARRAAHAVRSAIARFHEHLQSAVGQEGGPHPVLRAFADHIEKHVLVPSARYAGHGGPYARAGLAGCFTYERPGGVLWEE